ncbi:MAG: DUF47 family protein [Rhodospirillales bacterium]|jgi:uncharacterized protein|nr:DUF47 family protein [Rhodospirillales bacterium]
MAFSRKTALFGRTRALERQIEEFLDAISEAGLIFQRAIKIYLSEGASSEFMEALEDVSAIETRADELRRSVEAQLYEKTLIPDLRADVLSLLEDMDWLIGIFQANCYRFATEKPDIPNEYHRDFLDLTETGVTCTDCLVMAARAFFRNIEAVRDHNHKVIYYETEADKICTKMKTAIFESELPLDRKMHLRYFVDRLDEAANAAEDVADELAIYTIKRSI